jgi:hypothetical protein
VTANIEIPNPTISPVEAVNPKFVNENIPAMTRVQEWRSEDTGVGPSIASGSQSCVIADTDLNCMARISPNMIELLGEEW